MRLLAANEREPSGFIGVLGSLVAIEGREKSGEEEVVDTVRNRMQEVLSASDEGMMRKCTVRVSLESFEISRCILMVLFIFFSFFSFSVVIVHQEVNQPSATACSSILSWMILD
jgi:hypothetical protein